MRRCKICVMTDQRKGITFNKDGVCSYCTAHEEYMKVDWSKRWLELEDLCRKHRRNDGTHDCVIAVSGGKDSMFQVGLFKEKLNMNPLCVSLDNASWTKTGRDNIKNLNERFDVPILTFTPPRKSFKYYTRKDFEEKLHPNRYWDELLYELPYKIAKQFGIKLIIWGEDPFFNNIQYAGVILNKEYSHTDDIIFTSHFVPWNRFDNVKYAKANGFKCLNDTGEWNRDGLQGFSFEQVDTISYLVNQYCKFIQFGFSNQTELCSDAIRQGKMTRLEAIKNVNEDDFLLDYEMEKAFRDFIGITAKEFWEIIDKHANRELLEKRDGWWRLINEAK